MATGRGELLTISFFAGADHRIDLAELKKWGFVHAITSSDLTNMVEYGVDCSSLPMGIA